MEELPEIIQAEVEVRVDDLYFEPDQPPDFYFEDVLDGMKKLTIALDDISSTFPRKETAKEEVGIFIRAVDKVLNPKPPLQCPPKKISKSKFIMLCFEILAPDKSSDAITKAIYRANKAAKK